ncbi:MAG: hypothetical protein WD023_06820 [Ilumatobacteraceae bacterium]
MSSVGSRLGSYGLVLVGLFGTAYAVGERLPGHSHSAATMVGMDMGSVGSSGAVSADALGLSQVLAGYRLVVDDHTDTSLTFHLERDGARLTDFAEEHGALLHLLLVRHDLTGYQHLHPTMAADGTWTVDADLSVPGVWRMVADSSPTDADGAILVLGTDIVVPGAMTAESLPPVETMVDTDGLMVMRDGLNFTATLPDGSPAPGLDRYLGQSAHLVAFREGDLAYQHLHPDNDVVGDYRFSTPLPGPGTYRLFLQFTNDGQVVTVPFTVVQP